MNGRLHTNTMAAGLRLLGVVGFGKDGAGTDLPYRSQLALATLFCAGRAGVRPDVLAENIWPDAPVDSGRLRTMLSRLRSQLPEGFALQMENGSYRLSIPAGGADITVLEDVSRALPTDETRVEAIDRLLSSWPDSTPFDGLDGEIIRSERTRFVRLRVSLLLEYSDCSDPTAVSSARIAELFRLVERDPFDERAAQVTANVLAGQGQRVAALRVLDQNRAALVGVGLIASPESRQLSSSILRLPAASNQTAGEQGSFSRQISRPLILDAVFGALDKHVPFIVGPPGSGKSVLIEQCISVAAVRHPRRPIARIVVSSTPQRVMEPIATLLEWLRMFHPVWYESRRENRMVRSAWDRVTAKSTPGWQLGRTDFVRVLVESLADGLAATSALLVIEDVHHLDANCLEIFDALLRHWTPNTGYRIIVTGRPTASAKLTEIHSLQACVVEPFTADEVGQMVTATGTSISANLAEELRRRAGGNALFLSLLVALVRESELSLEMPDSILRAVEERLGRFGVATRNVLDYVALSGVSCSIAALEGLDPAAPGHLADAAADGLVSFDGPNVVFRHELVAEAIRHQIPVGRAASLQDALCTALLEAGASQAGVATMAFDAAAFDPFRAITCCLRAARDNRDVFAWESVDEWSTKALGLLTVDAASTDGYQGELLNPKREQTNLLRAELLLLRGTSRRARSRDGSESDLLEAADLAAPEPDLFADIVVELCHHGPTNRTDEVRPAVVGHLMAALGRPDCSARLPELKCAAATAFLFTEHDRLGRTLYIEAFDGAASLDPQAQRTVLLAGLTGLRSPEDVARFDEAIQGLNAFDDLVAAWEREHLSFVRAMRVGSRQDVESAYKMLCALRAQTPRDVSRSFTRVELGYQALSRDAATALTIAQGLPGSRLHSARPDDLVIYTGAMASLDAALHCFGSLRPWFQRLLETMPWSLAQVAFDLCARSLGGENVDEESTAFVRKVPLIDRDLTWSVAQTCLARVAFRTRNRPLAEAVSAQLAPFAAEMVWAGTGVHAPFADALALCAEVTGDRRSVRRYQRLGTEVAGRLETPHLRLQDG